jgi:hypothetical protein
MKYTKAIFQPGRVWSFLKWNTYGRLTSFISALANRKQYDKIHQDLLDEDKFLLIVLDACRYDFFESYHDLFLEGDLEKVYSGGRLTFEYVANIWDGDHKDILYLSGIGAINSRVDRETVEKINESYPGDYIPKEHLRIRDVNATGWDEDLKTVPPEEVTEEALQEIDEEDKLLAHYLQPHDPYIGDYRLQDEIDREQLGGLNSQQTWDLYRLGLVSQEDVKKAYLSNLLEVLEEVQRLVEEVDDRRIVVTSDHGEMLGECGMVAHPRKSHYLLREVPWFEVGSTGD